MVGLFLAELMWLTCKKNTIIVIRCYFVTYWLRTFCILVFTIAQPNTRNRRTKLKRIRSPLLERWEFDEDVFNSHQNHMCQSAK